MTFGGTSPLSSASSTSGVDHFEQLQTPTGRHFAKPNKVWDQPAESITLADTEVEGRAVNLAFGLFNLLILLILMAIGTGTLIAAIAPSSWSEFITNRSGPLPLSSRAVFLGGAVISLGSVHLFGDRLKGVWQWARLRPVGELTADPSGITIRHEGVLVHKAFFAWESIKLISFDDGTNHDAHTHWRRFPIESNDREKRRYLFATDGEPVANSVLLISRPAPPNMVVVLNEPVTFCNAHIEASDAAFPPTPKKGMPSRPPREATDAAIIFLRAGDPEAVSEILSLTGKVRPLKVADIP